MISLISALRIVHIVCGVLWAGTIFFFVWLAEPSIRASGPEGGKVMMQLIRRGYLTILPLAAVLTVLSGAWLWWIMSGGGRMAWMSTAFGGTLTGGAVAAIIAAVIGIFGMCPAALQVVRLAPKLPEITDDAERAETLAEIERLKNRARTLGRVVAGLLLLAVVAMSVARYA